MESKSHAVITLLFTIILGTVIACIFFFLSRDPSKYLPYRILTEHSVGTLNKGGKVKFDGIDVGRVTSIKFSKESPGYIVIDLEIKKSTPITKGTIATIAYQPVLGISSIDLSDEGENPEKLATSAESPAHIPISTEGIYHKTVTRGQKILREIQLVTHSLSVLLNGRQHRQIFATIGDLNRRSEDWAKTPWQIYAASLDVPEKIHKGHETIKTLYQLAKDVKKVSVLIDAKISRLVKSDDIEPLEKAAKDARAVLNNINSILGDYRRGLNSPLSRRQRVKGPGE